MTNEPDQPDDLFEHMARSAGAALRRPPSSDGIARVRSARRRQKVVRSSIAAGATAIVVVVGLVVLTRPSDQSIAPTESPDATTATPDATSTTVTPSTTTTVPVPSTLNMTYTFSVFAGLSPVGDPQVFDVSGYTSLVAAWSSAGTGPTDAYLVLYETQASGTTEPEGDMTSVSIEVPDGHAYLVTDNGAESLTSATRVMWWRGDGRLWTVTNFGLTPERLTELTLAIQPGSGLPYVLPDPAMTFVGFNTAGSYESIRQDWTLDGSHLVLAVTNGGLAQQLADQVPVSIVERTIAGKQGYAITRTNGQIDLLWPTDTPDRWASLIVGPPLADRVDEIVAAITPI
jgi:hypothetical protein